MVCVTCPFLSDLYVFYCVCVFRQEESKQVSKRKNLKNKKETNLKRNEKRKNDTRREQDQWPVWHCYIFLILNKERKSIWHFLSHSHLVYVCVMDIETKNNISLRLQLCEFLFLCQSWLILFEAEISRSRRNKNQIRSQKQKDRKKMRACFLFVGKY